MKTKKHAQKLRGNCNSNKPHLQNLHFPALTWTSPFPCLSRAFSMVFDDDENEYPVYIPLRFVAVGFEIYYTTFQ